MHNHERFERQERPEEFSGIEHIDPNGKYRLAWYVEGDGRIQHGHGWRKGSDIVAYLAEVEKRHEADNIELTWIEDEHANKFRPE